MKIKYKKRLLNELAKAVDSPIEFMDALISLEHLTVEDIADKMGITAAHYYVIRNEGVGMRVGLKFSNAMGIDPSILNRVIADYNLKKLQERLGSASSRE